MLGESGPTANENQGDRMIHERAPSVSEWVLVMSKNSPLPDGRGSLILDHAIALE
jgi:hypothetical protein